MSLANYIEQIAQFCRTGELGPSLDLDYSRLCIYHEHVRKKIRQTLKRAFPLTHHVLSPAQWNQMIMTFLAEEECSSPFIWTLPKTFAAFAKKQDYAQQFNIPYLSDLLDFEWIEIEIYMMPDQCKGTFNRPKIVLEEVLSLNPENRLLTFSYPVFEKQPLPRPMKKGVYFLFAFRHHESKEVQFMSLSPFYCRVVDLLKNGNLTGRELLTQAATEFKLDLDKILAKGEQFLKDLECVY